MLVGEPMEGLKASPFTPGVSRINDQEVQEIPITPSDPEESVSG